MKKYYLIFLLMSSGWGLCAQSSSVDTSAWRGETQEDFLFHYYDQDGIHSAVTGGVGTEELSAYDSQVQVYIPMDSVSQLHIRGGVNYYSSASTDRIDTKISSASSSDVQTQLYIDWEEAPSDQRVRYGLGVGGATESDYLSGSISGFLAWRSRDRSREYQIQPQLFFDRWQLFFPDELRGSVSVDTDQRNAYNLGLTLHQIIGPRLQLSLSSDLSLQQGLLSTPFHRVYFPGEELPRLERFPNWRFRLPLGGRLHYYWGDFLIGRLFYRYYWDTFDLQSHTIQLGLAIKIGASLTLSPTYRFHHQLASRYFAPFRDQSPDAQYYTSDYDLATFDSQQWTLGIQYSPLYGIGRWRYGKHQRLQVLKSWTFRIGTYRRSDGLTAFMLSTGLGFSLY